MTRLFDVDDVERRVGTTKALEAIDPNACPACGWPLKSVESRQPALLRHGGYGATMRVTTLHCSSDECHWHRQSEQTEVNPKGDS